MYEVSNILLVITIVRNSFNSKVDEVRACIDSSLNSCSETAIDEIELEYTELVETANVTCVDDFFGCAIKYVHYVIQIIEWKAFVPQETSTASEGSTTETGTGSTGTESATTAPKTATQKSDTADSDKTAESASSGSTADSETGSTDDSKSKRSTGSGDTGTAGTQTTGSGTAETEKTLAEIQNITANRQETLTILCGQFIAAWECVEREWSLLSPSEYELVSTTYIIYHSVVLGICNGK